MMKQKIIDFLKKHILLGIALLALIVFILLATKLERQFIKTSADLVALQIADQALQRNRDSLQVYNIRLREENKRIQHEKDSIKILQSRQKAYLAYVIKKHKQEIDSLLNVPNDTVYVRLQPIYPNPEEEPLIYPFSGTQIRQIYSTALSYPRLQKEYYLQGNILIGCGELNKKYEASETNYKVQIENMNKNIVACDQQLGIRDQELGITQKQLRQKTFWGWVFKGTTIIFGTIAVLK
jgi:hypothetical protein